MTPEEFAQEHGLTLGVGYLLVGALLWWRIVKDWGRLGPMDILMLPTMMVFWPGLVFFVGLEEVWNR
jgi:hypothetical protein